MTPGEKSRNRFMNPSFKTRLEEFFWQRHANPLSGWSRTVILPAMVYAISNRRWKLLLTAIIFTVVNPLLFPKPTHTDAWMTKVVLAERYWREHDADIGFLSVLNVVNVPVTLYALYAAFRQNTGGATVATALSMTLKFAFVAGLVRRFENELTNIDLSSREES